MITTKAFEGKFKLWAALSGQTTVHNIVAVSQSVEPCSFYFTSCALAVTQWGWSEVSCTHNKTLILHLFVLSPRGKGTSLTHCVSMLLLGKGTLSSRYPSLSYLPPQDNCKVNVYSPYQHCSSLVRFIATRQHRTRTRNSICFLLIVGFCKQQWVCVRHGDDEEEEDVSLEQECSIVTGTGFIRKEEELRHDPSCWLNVVQKIVYKFAVVTWRWWWGWRNKQYRNEELLRKCTQTESCENQFLYYN